MSITYEEIPYEPEEFDIGQSVTINNVEIGMKVVRGKDWKWRNQDVGVGTIIPLSDGSVYYWDGRESYWTTVKWENGTENNYRIGTESYDLKICLE